VNGLDFGGAPVKALLASLLISLSAQGQEVVFLVRHAEKLDASKDSRLSAAGEARARALAAKLKDAGITSVWTTEYRRTQETAKPLADALHLTPKIHPANDSKGLIELLKKEGGRALVVGHANTVPEIVRMFGGKLEELHDDEFDGLFLVTKGPDGVSLVTLRQ
jgi:broad specificity phosphatase PhoE